jgi:uridine phosphorylase
MFTESELILNPDGSIYHLHLHPEQIAPTILTVGDPERVGEISKHFDKIEHRVQKREFLTHTGELNGQRLTVISTGIGTDNIDIVLNELDALVNIDLKTRTKKDKLTVLNFIRIGTSGAIQPEIPVDSLLLSEMGVGTDNLMHFYDADTTGAELVFGEALSDYLEKNCNELLMMPYCFDADARLVQLFSAENVLKGITVSCPGFYAPQGRVLRGKLSEPKYLRMLTDFKHKKRKLSNLEMETAAIYGLSRILGHRAVSMNAILANRATGEFSKKPAQTIDHLIQKVLTHCKNINN